MQVSITAEAVAQPAALLEAENMEYQLLCYTRKPDETMYYGPRLAYSMHIALREGDGKYIPLNHNSGVLFARATENADGSLNPKSLKKPYIVRLADGSFEIHALRIEGDGQAEENETELCFKSSDLVVYEEMSECDCTCTAQKPDEAGEAFDEALISGIVGCVPGNVISITEKEAQYLKNKLMTPEIVRLEVQDSVQVSGAEDIGKIQATAYYSDGTSLNRSVDWNVGEIDFTKKGVAQKIVYGAFNRVAETTGKDAIEVFEEAMNNIMPVLEVKAKRIGGATYQVPIEVRPERRQALGLRWLTMFSRKRSEKTMEDRLANEILDAANNTGSAVKRKEDMHKMAEANKAFAHYRF